GRMLLGDAGVQAPPARRPLPRISRTAAGASRGPVTGPASRVGTVARSIRIARGESLRDVAERAGFSPNQLWRAEQVLFELTEGKIRTLASALGVPPSLLFGDTSTTPSDRGSTQSPPRTTASETTDATL